MTISPNIGLHNQSTKNAVERGVNHDATKNKQNGLAPGQADSATNFSFADVCSYEAENATTENLVEIIPVRETGLAPPLPNAAPLQ